MDATLNKSQVVMNFQYAAAGIAVFNYEDSIGLDRHFVIPEVDWVDMGKPDKITVTIEPGDRLNAPE